jgi:transposase-like protein
MSDEAWLRRFAQDRGYELEPAATAPAATTPGAPTRRQRISGETLDIILTRYRAGVTVPTIARELGVSADTIKRHLRANGITLRDDRTRGTGPTQTADRIAQAGTNTRTIRAWARNHGFTVATGGQLPTHIIDAYLEHHTEQEHTQL